MTEKSLTSVDYSGIVYNLLCVLDTILLSRDKPRNTAQV